VGEVGIHHQEGVGTGVAEAVQDRAREASGGAAFDDMDPRGFEGVRCGGGAIGAVVINDDEFEVEPGPFTDIVEPADESGDDGGFLKRRDDD
jgi:hypothetical protein